MNWEIKAPYLEAIQGVTGRTPSEKYQRINVISRVISQVSRPAVDSVIVLPKILEPLRPLFRVEIGKVLRQYDVIICALKSEDLSIIFRACQARWFFKGTETTLVNAAYFTNEVFPHISLIARRRVIKKFGRLLANPFVAADFFMVVADLYGTHEAVPLLLACNEQFAFDVMVRRKINLPIRMVRALYKKYPNLVVKYLMLSKSTSTNTRDAYTICIYEYLSFLPQFAVKHMDEFMKLYHMHDGLKVRLGKRAGNLFLKKCFMLLAQNPCDYIHLVSLKLITKRLSRDHFVMMCEKWLPRDRDRFKFFRAYQLLHYYKPEKDKLPLVLKMFRKVYRKDLLQCLDLVTPQLMQLLPSDTRVELARLKLQNDQDWNFQRPELSWRCYLPISESIPIIQAEFGQSLHGTTRSGLTTLAVLTCKINNDRNALSNVLNYAYENHRNEYGIFNFLYHVQDFFDLSTFDASLWAILNKFIKLVQVPDQIMGNSVMLAIVEKAFHYSFLHDLPTDDYVRVFITLKLSSKSKEWNILTKYPKLERKCLDLCINAITTYESSPDRFWISKRLSTAILGLTLSLYKFYERNKRTDPELQNFSVKEEYPWLFEKAQEFIFNDWEIVRSQGSELLVMLKRNENDFYREWLNSIEQFSNLEIEIMSDILTECPERIVQYWKECFDRIQARFQFSSKECNDFLKKCRWYEDLPIRFLEASLENFRNERNSIGAVKTFAILLDGQTFSTIIEPIVPKDERMDIDEEDAQGYLKLLLVTTSSLRKPNPPVSLDIIAKFCITGFLQMAMRSATNICRRVPTTKAISFAKSMTDRRATLMRLGIRTFYMVGTLADYYDFLVEIWNKHRHVSIRTNLFKRISNLFVRQPEIKSWHMMQTCISTLDLKDYSKIFDSLVSLDRVPNEYLREYIQFLLVIMDQLRKDCSEHESRQYIQLACTLINGIDFYIIEILPEEYNQQLIKTYLFNFNYNEIIFQTGRDLLCRYLFGLHEYHVLRFDFFAFHFHRSVQLYWHRSTDTENFRPVKYMLRNMFEAMNFNCKPYNRARCYERLLEIFLAVLTPHDEMCTYINLVFNIEFHKFPSMRGFAVRMSERIPHLIVIFSPELTMLIGTYLRSFLLKKAVPGKYEKKLCLTVAEGLIESRNDHCCTIASMLYHVDNTEELQEQQKNIFTNLRNSQHPAVISNLYAYINLCEYQP